MNWVYSIENGYFLQILINFSKMFRQKKVEEFSTLYVSVLKQWEQACQSARLYEASMLYCYYSSTEEIGLWLASLLAKDISVQSITHKSWHYITPFRFTVFVLRTYRCRWFCHTLFGEGSTGCFLFLVRVSSWVTTCAHHLLGTPDLSASYWGNILRQKDLSRVSIPEEIMYTVPPCNIWVAYSFSKSEV